MSFGLKKAIFKAPETHLCERKKANRLINENSCDVRKLVLLSSLLVLHKFLQQQEDAERSIREFIKLMTFLVEARVKLHYTSQPRAVFLSIQQEEVAVGIPSNKSSINYFVRSPSLFSSPIHKICIF